MSSEFLGDLIQNGLHEKIMKANIGIYVVISLVANNAGH